MAKYLLRRLLYGLLSVVAVVILIMIMIYSLLDRNLIFASDPTYTKQQNNQKATYKYQKWEDYGYLDYVTYSDYLNALTASGEIDEETRSAAVGFGRTPDKDSELVKEYVEKFTNYYKSQGYTVERLDAVLMGKKKVASGGQQQLYAYKNIPLFHRVWDYFTGILEIAILIRLKMMWEIAGFPLLYMILSTAGRNFHRQSSEMERGTSILFTVIPHFRSFTRIC